MSRYIRNFAAFLELSLLPAAMRARQKGFVIMKVCPAEMRGFPFLYPHSDTCKITKRHNINKKYKNKSQIALPN